LPTGEWRVCHNKDLLGYRPKYGDGRSVEINLQPEKFKAVEKELQNYTSDIPIMFG